MLRARIVAIGFGLLVLVGVTFYPATLAYTQWFGESAVATVTDCHPGGKKQNCHGTWVDQTGRTHSGSIDEVYSSDVGHQVGVRVGPFGARKQSTTSKYLFLAMFLLVGLVVPAGAITAVVILIRRRGSAGRDVLAVPAPAGWTTLLANGNRVWRPDGTEVAVLRRAETPTVYRPSVPSGRIPHKRSGSLLETLLRRLAHNPTKSERFSAAYAPGGVVLFLVDRTPAGTYEPETAVVDPGGVTRAVIRRTPQLPRRFALLGADGRDLGAIEQTDRWGVGYVLRDEHGQQRGTITADGKAWVLRLEDRSPLRDLAITFAVDAYRLRL